MLFSGKNCTKTALYLRLSREDGDKAESESISNQRELLADYLKEHPTLTAVEEYADATDILGLKQNPTKRASL